MYRLIVDGSYANGKTGIGIVESFSDKSFCTKGAEILRHIPIKEEYLSLASEYLAAYEAIKAKPKGCNIKLYTDNESVSTFINTCEKNHRLHRSPDIGPMMIALQEVCNERFVTASHKRDDSSHDIPHIYFSIAHNASAWATGSLKLSSTFGYSGTFSRDHLRKLRNLTHP